MESNVVGPALIAQHFLPLLKKGGRKVIINMTSGLGSISKDLGPKCSIYSISKAALNMLVSCCHDLHSNRHRRFRRLTNRRRRILTSSHSLSIPDGIRPVRNGCTPLAGHIAHRHHYPAMGGEGAVLEPDHSVSLMIPFFEKVSKEHSGHFFSYDGTDCGW